MPLLGWAVVTRCPGSCTAAGMEVSWGWLFWEIGQGLGMESHSAHSQHSCCPSPCSGNTHRGLRTCLQNVELCPASIKCFWSPQSSHRACRASPRTFPTDLILERRGKKRFLPTIYPASCYRTIDPRTDSPSCYGRVVLKKGKWILYCIHTSLLQDLHHHSFFLELAFLLESFQFSHKVPSSLFWFSDYWFKPG